MTAIIDYNAGNLTSVRLALEALGAPCVVTRDPAAVAGAERIVFPGVGAAGAAMASLRGLGLDAAIRSAVARAVPFLGICLGAQILLERSAEDGGVETLGILPGEVVRIAPTAPRAKIPHMGWNQAELSRPHPVWKGVASGADFYFVHSFCMVPSDSASALCTTEYGGFTFVSAIARANVVATQFHVEKSGRTGLDVLANFLAWDGREGA